MASSDTDSETAMGCLLMLILLPFTMLLRGFVLTRLWLWFIVPLGVMEVKLAHAYGISVLVGLFTMSWPKDDENEDKKGMAYKVFKMALVGFLGPLLCWLIGWVCYCWM